MKKLLLSIVIIFSAHLNAQEFSWGPKLSVSSPSLKLMDVKNLGSGAETLELLEDTDPILGYQLGLFARISLLGLYIQPEVLFSNTKSEIQFSDVMDENQDLIAVSYTHLRAHET